MSAWVATESPACAPRVIGLTGPTGAGKTAAALALAARYPCEVISVDSALVYRGMDIGTAKPTPAERAAVRHHLIDIRDPLQAYSAAQFAADARELIGQINRRGKLALLVGGTLLYFKALLQGLDSMPAADPALRAQLAQQAAQRGWPALHAQLAEVDPQAAARLAPLDSQRIQRALEVFRLTGRPISSFQSGRRDRGTPAPIAMPLFSLEPDDRAWLHQRIAQRFSAMLAAGLVDEVRALRARGDLTPELPSMRCVGYRQAWDHLEGALSLEQLRDQGIFATRQLAKRQLTWLRGMPGRTVVACDAPEALARLLRRVAEATESLRP